MSMQFDWYIGNIDRALDTDVYDNAALLDGRAWDDFAAAIGRLSDELKRPDVPHAPVDTAAGYRHLMAMVANGIGAALIPADPLCADVRRDRPHGRVQVGPRLPGLHLPDLGDTR